MPEVAETTPVKTRPKRGRIRRALKWMGIALLIVAFFHRPLFHFTVRLALRAVAARMHLDVDLHTSGTIFTNLTVEDVRARAEGARRDRHAPSSSRPGGLPAPACLGHLARGVGVDALGGPWAAPPLAGP